MQWSVVQLKTLYAAMLLSISRCRKNVNLWFGEFNPSAKVKLRLSRIFFTISTHVETVCLLELSMFPVTVAGEGK